MSEEEKEAIEILETLSCYGLGLVITDENIQAIDIVLDYIEKLQKENKDLELAYGLYKDTAEKLQKENEEYHRIKKELIRVNKKIYDVDTIDEFIKTIDKLQKENERYKKAIDNGEYTWKQKYEETFGYVKELIEEKERAISKLQKENKELKEENKKISKAADKMYEYISYYGWEDFESNTGCNREEMVDYFYKE